MTLTDITDDCKYLVYYKYDDGLFYHIQAEQKSCYRSVATMIDGVLSVSSGIENSYVVKFKKDVLKIYRIGGMKY